MPTTFAPVSVVIPVLNGADLITVALESIVRQTCRPAQVVVVESSSSTSSVESICRRFPRVTFLRVDQTPAGTLRNIGAASVDQPHLAFLDCDDIWPESRTELLLSALTSGPGWDYVSGRAVQVELDDSGTVVAESAPVVGRLPTNSLMRTDVFSAVGGFRDEWRVGETIEWVTRADDHGMLSMSIDDVVLLRRVHKTNLGKSTTSPEREYLRMLHDVISRRRSERKP